VKTKTIYSESEDKRKLHHEGRILIITLVHNSNQTCCILETHEPIPSLKVNRNWRKYRFG